MPEPSGLTEVNEKLPDPFTFFNGTKVTTKEQWECRRKEILAMAAKYLYGPVPGEPDEVTGTVSGGNVSITAKVGGKSESFSASISGSGSVIALKLSGGIFPSGHKTLSFGSGFQDKIKNLFGLSEVNTNIANGWMIDRVMDVLEKNPGGGHDPTKVMVSGCSGCGKGAYLAGVFSRAPVVVIVESGGGGVANLRQAEWFRHGDGGSVWQCRDAKPQSIDNLEDNGICGPWVTGAARWLRSDPSKVYNLPFDTHMLLATIAPRHLVHFTNANGKDSWCHLGGTCEALSAWAAKPVWKALGVPERMGFTMYSANHCGASGTQTALAGEMFKRAFEGNASANTDVMNILDNGVQQPVSEWKTMWVDWDMDTVLQ
ncbi:glucuronyl esterase domain-containing protein [Sorangium sp. So ce117]|uniref:glucuronyl esterase domain-containing protein n=1 Tax=Sorangium sp. So ce117 TaxID=3133277 RepID=UPI003F5FCF5C